MAPLNNNELRIKRIDAGLNSFLSQFVVVFFTISSNCPENTTRIIQIVQIT